MCVFYPLAVNRLGKSIHLDRQKRTALLNSAAKMLAKQEKDEVVITYLLTTTGYSLSGVRAMLAEARIHSKFLKGSAVSERTPKNAVLEVNERTVATGPHLGGEKGRTLSEPLETNAQTLSTAKPSRKERDPFVVPEDES